MHSDGGVRGPHYNDDDGWTAPWGQSNDPLTITLAVCCMLIWLSVVQQLRLIVHGGHNFFSLQTGVLLLTSMWLPLRILFWIKIMLTSTWNTSLMLMLYALPTCLEFSAFSCLALFYARVVNWRDWHGQQLLGTLGSESDDTLRDGRWGAAGGGQAGSGGVGKLTPRQGRLRHFGLRRDKSGQLDVRSRYIYIYKAPCSTRIAWSGLKKQTSEVCFAF